MQAAMILPSGVRYSILRNNVEVPLIPIDQLPFYIQGLPRELTRFRSHQEGWKSIGETQQPALPLSIQAPSDLQSSQPSLHTNRRFLPPDHGARKDLDTMSQASEPLQATHPAPITPAEGAVHRLVGTSSAGRPDSMMTEGTAATRSEGVQYPPYRPPNPSGIEPDLSKKEYCTHWIRTNSCDYMQQGCRYKHAMPDGKKLEELGFPEIPKWYRDKMAISTGASSWFRPRAVEDNNRRQLSVEPSASRAFCPSVLGLGRNQSRTVELPGSLAPKADQVPVELPNLIDLDDFSMATVSLPPSLSISSPSDAASLDARAIVAQPSEQVTKTLASSLRQEGPEVKKHTNAPVDTKTLTTTRTLGRQKSDDALLVVYAGLANDTDDSPPQTLPQSVVSDLNNGQEASKENNNASKATERGQSIARSSAAPRGKRNSKSSKPQQKQNPRPRKLAKRAVAPSTRDGLASSQHATGKKPREENTPSKGLKCGSVRDEGKDLQFEIMQCQRAVHEKEQLSKGAASNDVQSLVATGKTEAA